MKLGLMVPKPPKIFQPTQNYLLQSTCRQLGRKLRRQEGRKGARAVTDILAASKVMCHARLDYIVLSSRH